MPHRPLFDGKKKKNIKKRKEAKIPSSLSTTTTTKEPRKSTAFSILFLDDQVRASFLRCYLSVDLNFPSQDRCRSLESDGFAPILLGLASIDVVSVFSLINLGVWGFLMEDFG